MDRNLKEQATGVLKALAEQKEPDLAQAAEAAMTDEQILGEVLGGIVSKQETYAYNCFKVLREISEQQPMVLYPHWDYFAQLLASTNSYQRIRGLSLLANLTSVDTERKFEDLFDQYFGLLDDEKVITAIYLAANAGTIARFKPHLQTRITRRLLDIDRTHHTEGRKDLIKAAIIQSFERFFVESQHKEEILAFVEGQLGCSSPKTRKAAKAFLKEHSV